MHGSRSERLYNDQNLRIIFGITLMAVLGVSSITPAFPKIMNTLQISAQSVGLLITVFTLPGIILTPLMGVLADRYGRKKILVPALFLFGVAGFACGLVRDFHLLLVLRTLQGIGAASLGSLNATLIGDLYKGEQRATAMGYNASVLSTGTAGYPVIGGALALFGWHFPFFLPVFALPLGLVVLWKLNNPEPHNVQPLRQYLGSTFQYLWRLKVLILFLLSIITFVILYGAYLTYLPILINQKFAGSSFVIGLIMSSMSLVTAITSSQLGRLNRHFAQKTLLSTAFSLYTISLILLPVMPRIYLLLLPTILFGLAQGLNIPTIQTMLTGLAPLEHRGAFMSVNGMVLRIGQTLGPLFAAFLFAIGGLNTLYAGSAFLAFGTVSLIFFIRTTGDKPVTDG